ncbi:hypothetical protein Pelo_9754 [Pelomyxa schiedti]|nr:hypothetical protein Pelo_9754 [Pelomyxa schiedti]
MILLQFFSCFNCFVKNKPTTSLALWQRCVVVTKYEIACRWTHTDPLPIWNRVPITMLGISTSKVSLQIVPCHRAYPFIVLYAGHFIAIHWLQGDVSSGRDKCLLLKRALMLLEHGYQSVYHRLAPGPGPPCIWDKGYKSLLDMDLHVGREMSTPFSQLLTSSGVTLIPPSLTSNTGLPKSVAPLLKKALPAAPASSSASLEPPPTTAAAAATATTGTGAQTASDSELSEALVGLITGYLQQIASDREALQRCFERRPAVDAMLGQIRGKRASGDS